jgi:hypothetical protein
LYQADKLYDIEEGIGVLQDMKNAWLPCAYMGMAPQKYGRPEGFTGTDEGKELIKSMRQGFEKRIKCQSFLIVLLITVFWRREVTSGSFQEMNQQLRTALL